MTRKSLMALLSSLAAAGCTGGSETGNPVVNTEIGLSMRSSTEAFAVGRATSGTVIEEAWVSFGGFGSFDFRPEGECEDLGEEEFPPWPSLVVADLARPDTRISVDVQARSYCGLVVPLKAETDPAELPADAPAELANHGVVLRGQREDGTRFVLAHAEEDELELIARNGTFEVSDGGPPLLLSFDIVRWMEGVDLDGAELGDDGTIRIDAVTNPALLHAFEENAECSLDLYSDADGDGVVDEPQDELLARCAPN